MVLSAALLVASASGRDLSHARGEGLAAVPDTAAGLYRRYCQSCHGADGAGQTGVTADAKPNFTRRAWQEQRDDAALLVSILDGKGTGMPAFQDRLSEVQARRLIAHIRAFAPAAATAPARHSPSAQVPRNDFAEQFRRLQEEFVELQEQLKNQDAPRQNQSKPGPRTGEARSGLGARVATGKRTGMEPGTQSRATSTVAEGRRASADDRQEPQESAELAARILPLFSAKCAPCHGADLPLPKGKFGYVLDLARVRGNPKLVVPSRPDESKLWVLIRDNEMPPKGDPIGPLTSVEKRLVYDWIAAGAPIALTYPPDADGDPPAHAPSPSHPRPAHGPAFTAFSAG
jgi:mono/diheme cytochrome c family protein